MKAITLMALTTMLRPSDIAPKAVLFDEESDSGKKVIFKTDMIQTTELGLNVTLFGIKNDTTRTGFEISIPRHSDELIDPVAAIEEYIKATSDMRSDGGVFIGLNKPYKAISAAAVGKVLEEAIGLAGLAGMGFTAKSFRPTGATKAIERGIEPEIVQKVGRWKSTDVFYQHYVHSRTPVEFTDAILE